MYRGGLILIFFCFSLLISLSAQKNPSRGIHISYLANYNQFHLSKHTQYTTGIPADVKLDLRSSDGFPDDYKPAFQFGFINHKKPWHDFRFSFIYMPTTEKVYDEYKLEGQDWKFFEKAEEYEKIEMELYMINIAHLFKINLAAHHLYLNLGFGGAGGILRWPKLDKAENDAFHLTYYGYPIGGFEILLGKHIGINAEYQYQWGKSISQATPVQNGKITWEYQLRGHELSVGLNFYFSAIPYE